MAILASADAVVVARLTTRRPEVVQDAYCLWSTRYLFSVQDVVKGDVQPGENVWVRWQGRPVDVVIGFPRPRVGEQFLFFLKRRDGDYASQGGPLTTVRVVAGRLVPIREFRRVRGVPDSLEPFLAQLRAAK